MTLIDSISQVKVYSARRKDPVQGSGNRPKSPTFGDHADWSFGPWRPLLSNGIPLCQRRRRKRVVLFLDGSCS